MKLFFRIAAYCISFILGCLLGIFFVRTNINTAEFITPILEDLHLQKRFEVIGFAPYWLIPKQSYDYTDLLTSWTYFGLVVNPDGTIQKLVADTEEEPGWTTLKGKTVSDILSAYTAKQKNRSLLLHLSNEDHIGTLLSDATASAITLTNDVTPILTKYEFTDLNLDIESFRDASESARRSYITFLSEVKKTVANRHTYRRAYTDRAHPFAFGRSQSAWGNCRYGNSDGIRLYVLRVICKRAGCAIWRCGGSPRAGCSTFP